MTKKRQIDNVLKLQSFSPDGSGEVNSSVVSPASIALCFTPIPGMSTASVFLCNN